MRSRWLHSIAALLLAVVAFVPPASAQRSTRAITPIPFNDNSPAALSVSMDPKEARIGATVSLCFQSSRAGYATLWNISTDNKVSRIFPNQFTKTGAAAPVDAGKQYCAGTSGDPFRFRVDGPAGIEDLYLLWTTRPELQPTGANYGDAAALVADMQRLGGANSTEWGAQKLTYDVVPAAGPTPPPMPPQEVSGATNPPPGPAQQTAANDNPTQPAQPAEASKVYIFAMGANVSGLTKSNQDAAYFAKAMTGIFGIPKENIHLVANGKNADFVKGMDWLKTTAKSQDFVFIYFSGHGGRFKSDSSDDGWDEFLVPYDFEAPNPDPKSLLFSQVIDLLINRLPSKNVVAVIDACNSAGVYRSLEASVLGARSKYYALPPEMVDAARAAADAADPTPRTRAAGGRNRVKANGLLLAAAARDKSALEGSEGSFFTLALVKEMLAKDGGNLMDVFGRTVKTTRDMTENRQEPVAVGDAGLGRSITFE